MDPFINIDIRPAGYALMSICREPVNSMNLALWTQLLAALDSLENNPAVRGMIVTSGLARDVFTAGNDLFELFAPKTSFDRYKEFWVTQNRFLARLYRSPLFTIAAIRGACPAGGCGLSLCCDVRLMTEFGNIGLNEVSIGLPVPEYWAKAMVATVGQRMAEKLLQTGTMLAPQDAKNIGLVDEIHPKDELIARAEQIMTETLRVPDPGRRITKRILREELSRKWEDFCVPEADWGWKQISDPATVKVLESVLQRLSKK